MQSDLSLKFKDLQIETGAKFINFENNSDISYFDFVNQGYIKVSERSNIFQYKEKNYALYASSTKDFGEK